MDCLIGVMGILRFGWLLRDARCKILDKCFFLSYCVGWLSPWGSHKGKGCDTGDGLDHDYSCVMRREHLSHSNSYTYSVLTLLLEPRSIQVTMRLHFCVDASDSWG